MNKKFLALLLCLVATLIANAGPIAVYFSPNGRCTEAAVAEINKAQKTIIFEAYNFTSPQILGALMAAHARGVSIQAIYDRSQKNNAKTLADELEANSGVARWYGSQKIMHDKVLVIDSKVVVTGSFNFTTNAQRFNAENLIVLTDPDIAKRYEIEFKHLRSTAHQ